MSLRLGDGPLQGWKILPGERSGREKTGRGALLQAVLYQEADDAEGEWRLLDWRSSPGGLPLVHELAAALLERHAELAETFDPAAPSLASKAEAEGYTLLHLGTVPTVGQVSALDAAIKEAEEALGPAEIEEWPGPRIVALWPSGEVLAFERHPVSRIFWRECSAAVAAELDQEEADEKPLEQPTPELVQAMQEKLGGPGPVASDTAVPSSSGPVVELASAPAPDMPDRYQDNPPTELEKLQAEFDQALDEIADRGEQTAVPPGQVACPDCNGSGYSRSASNCTTCNRTGRVSAEAAKRLLGWRAEQEAKRAEVIAEGEAAASNTLEQARAELRTVWDHLANGDMGCAPVDAWCCSCTKGFAKAALSYEQAGGYTSWAHPECVEAERARVAEEEKTRQAEREAADAQAEADQRLSLALGAEDCKPFKARHKGDEDPACELCLKPIRRGDLTRRKSKTSSKRLHDSCVRELLDQRKEAQA